MGLLYNLNDKVLGIVDSSPISKMSKRVRINNRLAVFLKAVAPEFYKIVLCAPVVGPESPMYTSRSYNMNVPNVEVIEMPGNNHLSQLLITKRAFKKVDFVWLFYGHAALIYFIGRLFSTNCPFGIQVEGNVLNLLTLGLGRNPFFFTYRIIFNLLQNRMAKRARFILVIGNQLYSEFSRIAGTDKVYNISPLLDLAHTPKSKRIDSCQNPVGITCLFVGRISYPKGCQHLLEAIALLNKQEYNIAVRIVGDGEYLPELKAYSEKLDIKSHVIFTGHIAPGPDLWAEYERSDIFILPSYSEGLPKVFYEASAFGLPIITTKVGGIGDVFLNEISSLHIEVGSSKSIADAIVRLKDDPTLRSNLIKNGREIAIRAHKESKGFGKRFVTLLKRHIV